MLRARPAARRAVADPNLGLAEAYVTRLMRAHERAEVMDVAMPAALAHAGTS
ncbi:MAG TPA: hypothetical protein VMJ65_13595 [Solirubrobacteraceae bacterium]|nr:hypothetical protein [Solirubrobacteraceae bacterium]